MWNLECDTVFNEHLKDDTCLSHHGEGINVANIVADIIKHQRHAERKINNSSSHSDSVLMMYKYVESCICVEKKIF